MHFSHFTVTRSGKDKENKEVLSLDLKVDNDDDVDRVDVTSGCRLFHVFAAATGKARSLMVRSRVDGTTSADVDDERRHCRPGSSATGCRSSGLPSRSARVRGGIGVLARLACRKFAQTHVTNAGDRAAE